MVAPRLVGAHVAAALAHDLHHAHGQGVHSRPYALVATDDGRQVVQAHAVDGVKVGGVLRVLKAQAIVIVGPGKDALQRHGLAKEVALQPGAARLLQEAHLLARLHALAQGVDA